MRYTVQEKTSHVAWDQIASIKIDSYIWGKDYMPETKAWLYHITGQGFMLKMRCEERAPRATYTEANQPVYKDSCMEFFANYYPGEEGTGYINFEMNSNGAVLCEYGQPGDRFYLKDRGFDVPTPQVTKGEDFWEIELCIPDAFIKEVYGKDFIAPMIKGNFYKCGDDTDIPHYGSWAPIDHPTPAFHKPVFFGELVVQ